MPAFFRFDARAELSLAQRLLHLFGDAAFNFSTKHGGGKGQSSVDSGDSFFDGEDSGDLEPERLESEREHVVAPLPFHIADLIFVNLFDLGEKSFEPGDGFVLAKAVGNFGVEGGHAVSFSVLNDELAKNSISFVQSLHFNSRGQIREER